MKVSHIFDENALVILFMLLRSDCVNENLPKRELKHSSMMHFVQIHSCAFERKKCQVECFDG